VIYDKGKFCGSEQSIYEILVMVWQPATVRGTRDDMNIKTSFSIVPTNNLPNAKIKLDLIASENLIIIY